MPSQSQPLAGRRILVTRALHQAGKLSAGLRALGAEPVEVPLLEIRPPASFEALDHALGNLAAYDWLLFTSANTVQAAAGRARELGISLAGLPGRIAAVGAATAESLTKEGLAVALVPRRYVAEGLIESLSAQEPLSGKRILRARAAIARDAIPEALRAAGARVDVADAYRNVLPASAGEQVRAAMAQPMDAALFTSSSTVEHLAEAARQAGLAFPLPGVPAVSIGPITSQTLCELGWPPAAEADPHDIPGLLEAVTRTLR